MKLQKLCFKRKKSGGGSNWGAGWDDLITNFWEDLEIIDEDNYYSRHNEELIKKVFLGMSEVMENKVLPRMRKYAKAVPNNENDEWLGMGEEVLGYFQDSRTINDKVIAINCAEQFIRACDPDSKKVREILGGNDV